MLPVDVEKPRFSGCGESFHSPLDGKEIRILYEDNHLIALEKPAGITTQGDITGKPSLFSSAKDFLKEKYQKKGNVFLGMIHRLDKDVSGVVLFCKTSKAASRLSEQIRNRQVQKDYAVLVEGSLPGKGRFEDYLAKNNGKAWISNNEKGKKAILDYEAKKVSNGMTRLSVRPITGRYHQIRIQFASRKHPVCGDAKYGSGVHYPVAGIALHATRLVFTHPTLGKPLTLESPARF